ncbi:MAG: GNAT family N-acetyltransferase [Pseudomonadota bacterium]
MIEQLIITTARLVLTPLQIDEASDLEASLGDPQVMRYVGSALSRAEIDAAMPDLVRRGGGGALGIWLAREKAGGAVVGDGVLLPLPIEVDDTEWHLLDGGASFPPRDIEVGYILREAAWGNGYATEICRALLAFAFRQTPLEQVVAVTDPDNAASKHVLAKCGLIDHGLRRAYAETVTDFRISRATWQEQRNLLRDDGEK